MPARPRHAETLKAMGYDGDVDDFRRTLAAVKADLYPEMTDEMLCFTRDEAAEYCSEVRKRLKAPRLTRVFLLKGLVSLRKQGWARKARKLATA